MQKTLAKRAFWPIPDGSGTTIYACLATSRFTNVAKRGTAVSASRAFFPLTLGGWPVGGGNDITGRLVPWACLTTTGATTSAATVLSAAAFFRVAFAFGTGFAGLILFT